MALPLVKATSPTFSKNPVLQQELAKRPWRVVLNTDGLRLEGDSLVEFLADADAVIVDVDTYLPAIQFGPDLDVLAGIFEGIAQQVAQRVGHGLAVEIDEQGFWQLVGVDRELQVAPE